MKIQTASSMPFLSKSATTPTSDGAFEQSLRALERDMWAGAASGESRARAVKCEPSTHAPRAFPQNRFEEAGARKTVERNVIGIGEYSGARDGTQLVGTRPDTDRTAVEHSLLERHFQADVSIPTTAFAPERLEARSCEKELVVRPLREIDASGAPSSAHAHQERTSPCAENRMTVHFGDDGMQLVMRIPGASRDEALALSRQTADALRRRMTSPVRVVVNGAQHEEMNLRKSPYPAFHGETYGN
ncbi:hypothetical protein [Caballeronia sp. INDeC2]|uniref:hypothetical protein n=1 Tax=Caballeronia sp. INDeC2 TaxID=2921747 RepID=UPI002029246D|nr:hypothetical protein [Caballeronia sp. INDeC2]